MLGLVEAKVSIFRLDWLSCLITLVPRPMPLGLFIMGITYFQRYTRWVIQLAVGSSRFRYLPVHRLVGTQGMVQPFDKLG